jgi:hypothetical protein
MKTELLNAGKSTILGKSQYDEIIIGNGFVKCFRNNLCYATYSLDCFDSESTQSFTIKDQE